MKFNINWIASRIGICLMALVATWGVMTVADYVWRYLAQWIWTDIPSITPEQSAVLIGAGFFFLGTIGFIIWLVFDDQFIQEGGWNRE